MTNARAILNQRYAPEPAGNMSGVSSRANRRQLLRGSLALGLAACGAALSSRQAAAQDTASADAPPNFVIVLTDDMRGTDWQALPRTQELLGAQGVTFPYFFATTPACSPARASLLTGMYAHAHGVWLGDEKDRKADITGASTFEKLGLPERTIAVALHDAGYHTALVGKYLNGFGLKRPVPPGWDEWYSTSSTDYVDFTLNENGETVDYEGQEDYGTDVLAARAVEVIAGTPAAQPLFLLFAPKAPHLPSLPATRHEGEFTEARVAESAAIDEADMSDKPAFLRELPAVDVDALHAHEGERLRTLLAVDEAVAEIVAALAEAGRLENSYIFVLSDHGYAMGQHRWNSKALPYDTVTRVPAIAFGPGFAPGTVDERLAVNSDVAPTIAALAGVTLGDATGRSLLDEAERSVVLLENVPGFGPGYRALRDRDWLYVEWESGERELYDYRGDPDELTNLLADWEGLTPAPEALAQAEALHGQLEALATCSGEECRAADLAPLAG